MFKKHVYRLGGLHSQKIVLSKYVKLYCFEGFPNALILLNISRTKHSTVTFSLIFKTNLLLLSFLWKRFVEKASSFNKLVFCFKFILSYESNF